MSNYREFSVHDRVSTANVRLDRMGTVVETEYREKDLQVKVRFDDGHCFWCNHESLRLIVPDVYWDVD